MPSAQKDGGKMPMEFAKLSVISAQPGVKTQEIVLPAMEATSSMVEFAKSTATLSTEVTTFSAEPGTEPTVSSAQTEPTSTHSESAHPSLTNAPPSTPSTVLVSAATEDTLSMLEFALNQLSLLLPISAATLGTLLKVFALSALKDTTSTVASVFPFPIFATLGTFPDDALFVMLVMTS